jgi:Homeodomain-like domain
VTVRERAKANALALRAGGLSIQQVADRLGVPHSTVGQWLRGRGEWYEVRECELCGERFIRASGAQRFCTPQHAGVSPKVASTLMGHKTPEYQPGAASITLRRYTHTLPGELERARDVLDKFLAQRTAAAKRARS